MRHFVCKYWALVSVACAMMLLSACGPEEPTEVECENNRQCGAGEICHLDFCVDEDLHCFSDTDCRSYESCNGLICEERETCENQSQCAPNKTCSGGECVAQQCSNDGDCARGLACDEGLCEFVPKQCANIGESCELGEASRAGFSCEDLGSGPTCYRKCNRYRECLASGLPGNRYDCGLGSTCVESGVGVPVCQFSECGGFFDADEDCANGEHCALVGGKAFTCQPAGNTSEGSQCNETSDCGEGFICPRDFGPFGIFLNPDAEKRVCTQACNSDDMCSGGESCIGLSDGAFEGVGICGDRCDPFSFEEQCSDDLACVAVTSDDGMCFRDTERSAEYYGACTGMDDCPDNSICLQTGDGVSRCQPQCDPTLSTQAQRNATCPQASTFGFVQLAHFVQEGPEVDILVDGEFAVSLQAGESTEDVYLQVEEGTRQIEVRTSAGVSLLDETLNITRLSAATISVVPDSNAMGGVNALVADIPRDINTVQDQALVRLVHGVAGAPDVGVVVVEADGDITVAADRVLDVDSISYGQALGFASIGVDSGDPTEAFDIYIFESGTDGSEPYLVVEDYQFEDGEVSMIFVVGDVQAIDPSDHVGPYLMKLDYISPPDGRRLGGYCQEVNAPDFPPEIGSGFCRETCATSDDWGGGNCTEDADACWPVGSNLGWCLPESNGNTDIGDSCSDDDDCVDGSHCDLAGDSGTCRSYCQTEEQTNPNLGCESGVEVCVPRSGYENFGECRLPCTPDSNNVDSDCPTGHQNCIGDAGASFCSASGSLSLGQDCGDPSEQNCSPGLACAQTGRDLNELLFDPFSTLNEGETATCRNFCEPFSGENADSGCGDGFACSPILPSGESTTLGHCVEAINAPLTSLADCAAEDIGSMCDENSFCVPASSNMCVEQRGQCLQLCDFATKRGCTGGTSCVEGFNGGPLLGLYGLCR